MKNLCCFFLLAIIYSQTTTAQIIEYFDEGGIPCAEKKATFVKKVWRDGNIWRLEERFYRSNNLITSASFSDGALRIPEGLHERYFDNGKKSFECFYVNGKKNGTEKKWAATGAPVSVYKYENGEVVDTSYIYDSKGNIYKKQLIDSKKTGTVYTYYGSGKLLCQTSVIEDKKDGDCAYYAEDGTLLGTNTYLKDSVIATKCNHYLPEGATCKNISSPEFVGAAQGWRKFLEKNLQYPDFAQENGIQGRVELQFDVDSTGNISNLTYVSSPHRSLSEEGLRLFKIGPKWQPAVIHGQPVPMTVRQPLTFRLE